MPRDLEHEWQMRRNMNMGDMMWRMYQWIDGTRADRQGFLDWLNYMKFWYQARVSGGDQATNPPVKANWRTDANVIQDTVREKRPDNWRVAYKDAKLTDSWRTDSQVQ